jgi:dTDP-4-amino-4,6-dideoxygalactose transaminase
MSGPPIPFNRPHVAPRGLDYVAEAVAAGSLAAGGPFGRRCERWLEEETGTRRACLGHSATAALEAAMMIAEVGPGDEVVMPSFGYPTMATAAIREGATPVFVDIDPATLNVDPERVAAAVGKRTRAITVVHYGGIGCAAGELGEIAAAAGATLVEDAAQGLLSSRDGRPLGSFGSLGVMSFHETKNVGCGEGGALLVNDEELLERAEVVWDKGTDRGRFLRGEVDSYTWVDRGSSFAAGELPAAFLLAQLEEAETVTARRVAVWERYQAAFAELEAAGLARRPTVPPGCRHNGHTYFLLLEDSEARAACLRRLAAAGVGATFHFVPLHSSPAGSRLGRRAGSLARTEDLAARLVRLPLYAGLTDAEADRVIEETHAAVRHG